MQRNIYTILMIFCTCIVVSCNSEGNDQKKLLLLDYDAFGPQVMAWELIGYDWYQWESHGDSTGNEPEPEIIVVVYRDVALEVVMKRYPVITGEKDYRYVEYSRAIAHLTRSLGEYQTYLQETGGDPEDSLKTKLEATIKQIQTSFPDPGN